MKILLISRGIPSKRDPQDGCFELDQAKALKSAGHEVIIMSVDSLVRNYFRCPGIKKRIVDGIKTYQIFIFPTSIIRRFLSFPLGVNLEAIQAKYLYNRIVEEEGAFDIIHAHFLTNMFYGVKIKQKYSIPIVGTEHWSKVNTDTPGSDVRYLAKRTYIHLDGLISVSEALKQRILKNFGINSVVIHNLIDLTYLSEYRVRNHFLESPVTIVLVGSLIKLKGFDFFLQCFANSKLKNENVIVKIIGQGNELQSLQTLTNDLSISDKVFFLGKLDRKKIFGELNNADFFVLPSRTENFSVAVLEALAHGLPVIATLCGGIRECINENNGLLVKVDDEGQMICALEKMYKSFSQYDSIKIRENCLSLYSPQHIAKEIENVFYKIIHDQK